MHHTAQSNYGKPNEYVDRAQNKTENLRQTAWLHVVSYVICGSDNDHKFTLQKRIHTCGEEEEEEEEDVEGNERRKKVLY